MRGHSVMFFVMMLFLFCFKMTAQEIETKQLQVAEARLGKDVKDRALVDKDSVFTVNERAYLWIKVTGGPSDSISVTWKIDDQSYMTKLNIGGNPWRTWSYKTLAKAGKWTVTVSDPEGNVLKELSFNVEEKKN